MNSTTGAYETTTDFISKDPYATATATEVAEALSTIIQNVTTTIITTAISSSNSTAPKDEQNLGLIIGLSVGIPCGVALIIALAVAIFYFYKRQIKPQKQVERRSDSGPGSFYEINIPRATSSYYDDVAIPSRNEPAYDTVLQTYSPVYETTLPKHR